jgi:hypothetical protein
MPVQGCKTIHVQAASRIQIVAQWQSFYTLGSNEGRYSYRDSQHSLGQLLLLANETAIRLYSSM